MFSEIPRQSEHFNISQYLININIYKFTHRTMYVNTLKPPLSGHCRPEGAHNWEFARISELQSLLHVQSQSVDSLFSRFLEKLMFLMGWDILRYVFVIRIRSFVIKLHYWLNEYIISLALHQ